MFLGDLLERTKISSNRLSLYYTGHQVRQSDLDFFKQECKNEGCTVYFFGEYESDGDFGTFSKIVSSLTVTREQRDLYDDDDDELAYYDKIAEIIKSGDPEMQDICYDVVINTKE